MDLFIFLKRCARKILCLNNYWQLHKAKHSIGVSVRYCCCFILLNKFQKLGDIQVCIAVFHANWMRQSLIKTSDLHVTAVPNPSFWNMRHWYIYNVFNVHRIQSATSDTDLILHQWAPGTGFKETDWQMLCKKSQDILRVWCDRLRASGREENVSSIPSMVNTSIEMPFRLLYVFLTLLNLGWTEKYSQMQGTVKPLPPLYLWDHARLLCFFFRIFYWPWDTCIPGNW